jgi:hypothetical protein
MFFVFVLKTIVWDSNAPIDLGDNSEGLNAFLSSHSFPGESLTEFFGKQMTS